MKRKILLFAVTCVALSVLGAVNAGAQSDLPGAANSVLLASGYDAKVAAVRQQFAAERQSLGLPALSIGGGTAPVHLGHPRCTNVGGWGSAAGGSSSLQSSVQSVQASACSVSSKGAPAWMVDMSDLNFYMEDTPLWYDSPVGPSVELKVSYSSNTFFLDSPLGNNKWQMNFGSYLYTWYSNGLPLAIAVVMPDGNVDLYGLPDASGVCSPPYHVFDKLTQISTYRYELDFPDGTVYIYDLPPGGAVISHVMEMRDAHGQKLTLSYDGSARLATITDALGKETTFTYDTSGFLSQVTDPFGRSASFEYDASGNLTRITDMGGYSTSLTYAANAYLSGLTNGSGSWGFYFEPPDGDYSNPYPDYPAPGTAMGDSSRITITNPAGGKEEYFLYGTGWHVSPANYVPYSSPTVNNSAGSVPKTLYDLDPSTNEVSTVTTPEGNITGYGYDDYDSLGFNTGNITSVGDASGTMLLTYNSMGSVTSVDGLSYPPTNLTYAANGVDLTAITDDLGTIAIAYDGAHDITSVTDRMGNTSSFTYNAYGQITSSTDPLGVTTDYGFDANDLLSTVTRSGQTLKSYTHDSVGRVKTYTDPSGLTLTYDYDDLNDITKVTYPDGKFKSITYSTSTPGLITAVTDRSGNTTQYIYDGSRQLVRTVDPDGGEIDFGYDANGNMAQLQDQAGDITGFSYNNDNQQVTKSFADGTSASFTHDGAGRVASYTNARGGTDSYMYDGNDDLLQSSYIDMNTYSFSNVLNQYDAYFRLTGVTDDSGTTAYDYDADSRLTSIAGPLTNDTRTFTYDAKGRMTGYAVLGGQSVSYTYDDFNRLTSIQSGAGTFSYSYSGASPLVQKLTRPNGSYTEYQYDSLNRLTSISNKASDGSIINQYDYAYNAQDLRSGETVTNGVPVSSFTAGTTDYTYNSVNALLGSTNPTLTFAYDADGNLTQGYVPAGYPFTATYGAGNRLATLQYQYPGTYQGYPVEWTAETDYTYNGQGILALTQTTLGSTGATTSVNYVLNGSLPLQERDDNNNVTREYTWGLDYGGGIGGLLSLRQGGQDYFYLYDGKGNVTALIDSGQNVVETYAYDPFGKPMAETGTVDQPYRFSTKPYDENTGLSYYGYRFYVPSTARWLTRDPKGEKGGLNLYGFVKDNPLMYVDPLGMEGGGVISTLKRWFHISKDVKENVDKATETVNDIEEAKDAIDDPDPKSGFKLLKLTIKNTCGKIPVVGWAVKKIMSDAVDTVEKAPGGVQAAERQHDTGSINSNEASQLSQVEF